VHRYLREVKDGERRLNKETITLILTSMNDALRTSPSLRITGRLQEAYLTVLGLRWPHMRRRWWQSTISETRNKIRVAAKVTGADERTVSRIVMVNQAFEYLDRALSLVTSRLQKLQRTGESSE